MFSAVRGIAINLSQSLICSLIRSARCSVPVKERETAKVFEIFVIDPPRRSPFVICDTLFQARETATETVALTGCKVEIVDRRTGDVVERREPTAPT